MHPAPSQHYRFQIDSNSAQSLLWVQQNIGVFMKDITAALLVTVFVLYSLIALLSVERNQDSTNSPLVSNQERISDLGLRFAFKR